MAMWGTGSVMRHLSWMLDQRYSLQCWSIFYLQPLTFPLIECSSWPHSKPCYHIETVHKHQSLFYVTVRNKCFCFKPPLVFQLWDMFLFSCVSIWRGLCIFILSEWNVLLDVWVWKVLHSVMQKCYTDGSKNIANTLFSVLTATKIK